MANKAGGLQVWWIPQVPMRNLFFVSVESVQEGVKIMNVLAEYDKFQYKNKIKPDCSSAGGLMTWTEDCDGDGNPGWKPWFDEETGEDDPAEWLKEQGID